MAYSCCFIFFPTSSNRVNYTLGTYWANSLHLFDDYACSLSFGSGGCYYFSSDRLCAPSARSPELDASSA